MQANNKKSETLKPTADQVEKMIISAMYNVEGYFRYYIHLKREFPLEKDETIWSKMEKDISKYNAVRYNSFSSFTSAKNRFITNNRDQLKDLFL